MSATFVAHAIGAVILLGALAAGLALAGLTAAWLLHMRDGEQ